MEGYISKLRKKIGPDKFIHPAARIIVENGKGEILFIERTENITGKRAKSNCGEEYP